MTKRVVLDENIISKMKSVFGDDVSPDKYVVYKARAISNEPISKRGCALLDKAIPTSDFVRSLISLSKEPLKNISVHLLHEDYELAIGRVFDMWETLEYNSVVAAYAYLAILKTEDNMEVIEKIDSGILDEVSIGFEIASAKCSVCGFDFFDNDLDEETKLEHLWSATCPDGHVMGRDGAYLSIEKPKSFSEISIVNQGAAHHAKIQEIAKFSLSFDDAKKNAKTLLAEVGNTTVLTKLESKMTEEEMKIKFAEMEAKMAEMEAKLSSSPEAAPDEATSAEEEPSGEPAEPAPADEEKTDEKVKALEAEVEELKAEKEALKSELSEAKAMFAEEVNKALVAADKEKVSPETELSAMTKALHDANITLASIPAQGKARPASKTTEEASTFYGIKANQLTAYK